MRTIDADALKRKAQRVATEAWKMKITGKVETILNQFIDWINNAPTIEPEPKWIPCSETVDIPDHEIMACDKYGEIMFGYLVYEDEQWICASDGCVMVDAIAWREKPEPYREEGNPCYECPDYDKEEYICVSSGACGEMEEGENE